MGKKEGLNRCYRMEDLICLSLLTNRPSLAVRSPLLLPVFTPFQHTPHPILVIELWSSAPQGS